MATDYINNDTQGISQATGTPGLTNSYPVLDKSHIGVGLASNTVSREQLDAMAIDVDENVRMYAPLKFTMMNLLKTASNGGAVERTVLTWTDDRDSSVEIKELPLDDLRYRDLQGLNAAGTARGVLGATDATMPAQAIPLGDKREMGGKLIWQKVDITDGADASEGLLALDGLHALDTGVNARRIKVGASTIVDGDGLTFTSGMTGEAKETGTYPVGSNGQHITLAYSRSNTNFGGRVDNYIETIAKELKSNGYEITEKTGITWYDGTVSRGVQSTYSFKFKEGVSETMVPCHMMWENMSSKGSGIFRTRAAVFTRIEGFMYSADQQSFLITFGLDNGAAVNLDELEYSRPVLAGALMSGNYYMVTKGVASDGVAEIHDVGSVFRMHAGLTTITGEYCSVPSSILLEETNTSIFSDDVENENYHRKFMPSDGTDGFGNCRLGRRMTSLMWYKTTGGVSESSGYDITKMAGGSSHTLSDHKNFMQLFRHDRVWGKTTLSMNTQSRRDEVQKDLNRTRAKELATFDAKMNSTYYFGKGSHEKITNGVGSLDATFQNNGGSGMSGDYAGQMAGMLSYEDFPISYIKMPFVQMANDKNNAVMTDGGESLYDYLDLLAETIGNARRIAKGSEEAQNIQFMISPKLVTKLGLTNRRVLSNPNSNGNEAGGLITRGVPSDKDASRYIENFGYKASNGDTLTFLKDASLERSPRIPVPGNFFHDGLMNPNYCLMSFDFNNIKTVHHKAWPYQIHTSLQPNSNKNVFIEGAQASGSLEMRNCESHVLIDLSPSRRV